MSPRLIPAHAGKTGAPARSATPHAAHPRSRGENTYRRTGSQLMPGSSPLTRGKHVAAAAWPARTRLIPAHAGKTWVCAAHMASSSAHPRSRGENMVRLGSYADSLGSSPLTRGKLPDRLGAVRRRRLIPAHAGKTTSSSASLTTRRAHPRSRGENDQYVRMNGR